MYYKIQYELLYVYKYKYSRYYLGKCFFFLQIFKVNLKSPKYNNKK